MRPKSDFGQKRREYAHKPPKRQAHIALEHGPHTDELVRHLSARARKLLGR